MRSEIHIIGGGDAAIGVALSHLSAGYKVHIYEGNPALEGDEAALSALRTMASGYWIRQHNGGEYPTAYKTAQDLLYASVAMSQIMPSVVYNPVVGVQYLISNGADKEGKRTVKEQQTTTTAVTNEYTRMWLGNRNLEKRFGKPKEFARSISLEEIDKHKDKFVGGVVTSERGINPVIMTKILTDKLRQYIDKGQLKIHADHALTKVSHPTPGNFYATFKHSKAIDAKTATTITMTGRVINCAGINAFNIAVQLRDQAILKQQGAEQVEVHRRVMAIADISKVPDEFKKSAIFGMGPTSVEKRTEYEEDALCGMFAPINKNIAYVYLPTKAGAYVQSGSTGKTFQTLTFTNPAVSAEYKEPLIDAEARRNAIEASLNVTYPGCENAKILAVFDAPLVVVDRKTPRHLTVRTRLGEITDGNPAKAFTGHHFLEKGTHFAISGIESLKNTLRWEVARGKLSPEDANIALQKVYKGTIAEKSIEPENVNQEAWFSRLDKKMWELAQNTPGFYNHCLSIASNQFNKFGKAGEKIAEMMVASIGKKKPETLSFSDAIASIRRNSETLPNKA